MARGRLRWVSLLLLASAAASCSGRSVDPKPGSCTSDADCGSGLRCEKMPTHPVKGLNPCPGQRGCTSVAACQSGEVCAPFWQIAPNVYGCQPLLCGSPCQDSGCPADASCGADGVCTLTACDAPSAAACPDHWRCDPEAAASESHDYSYGALTPEPDVERSISRGCARNRCDVPGGYECVPLWACSSDATADPSGCAPVPCEKLGHCADDQFEICASESKHAAGQLPDPNGCVWRGCDEGFSCSAVTESGVDIGICDYTAAGADPVVGCAIKPCTQDSECFSLLQHCEPSHPLADPSGCRYSSCLETVVCPTGWVCDPARSTAVDGCVLSDEPPAGGGATATGGGSSVGAGGTGGSDATGGSVASGGTSSLPNDDGRCVPRD